MSRLLNAPFTEQQQRRQGNLVSPVAVSADIGATAATLYTGIADQSFLIRGLLVHNDTGGAITLAVSVNGAVWYSASVAAGATDRIEELEGMLIAPSVDVTATGQNLRVYGWGLRVQGGDAWAL